VTNGVGKDRTWREEQELGYDCLPPIIREVIANAPINLGAYGIAKHCRRMRFSEAWEWEAYQKDLLAFIDNVMKGGHTSGTNHVWRCDPETRVKENTTPHPQEARDYEWPNYQVYPRRTRVTEITLDRYTRV
jgi:hypothetical protein